MAGSGGPADYACRAPPHASEVSGGLPKKAAAKPRGENCQRLQVVQPSFPSHPPGRATPSGQARGDGRSHRALPLRHRYSRSVQTDSRAFGIRLWRQKRSPAFDKNLGRALWPIRIGNFGIDQSGSRRPLAPPHRIRLSLNTPKGPAKLFSRPSSHGRRRPLPRYLRCERTRLDGTCAIFRRHGSIRNEGALAAMALATRRTLGVAQAFAPRYLAPAIPHRRVAFL